MQIVHADWTPEVIRKLIGNDLSGLKHDRQQILYRLSADKRMRNVYFELLRKSRTTRAYLHSARTMKGRSRSIEIEQLKAVRELIHFVAFTAEKKIHVSTNEDVQQQQESIRSTIVTLTHIASELEAAANNGGLPNVNYPPALALSDASALRRVSNFLASLSGDARNDRDPLTVSRKRGDSVTRGVQIMISVKLEELFGNRLDRTAATLTSVALGVKTSDRTARSALTKPKRRK